MFDSHPVVRKAHGLPVLAGALAGLLSCDYVAPVAPNGDGVANVVTGTVVVDGVGSDGVGAVSVLVFGADDPPPPLGTGEPLTFATVSPDVFTGDPTTGVQSASYTLGNLADGDYLFSALMDVDGNFHPSVGTLAGASCGDWSGFHITDLETRAPAVVSVSGGELVENITIVLDTEYTMGRPAHYVPSGQSIVRQLAIDDPEALQTFELRATGIHSSVLEIADPGSECGASIPYYVVDADGDGLPDPHPDYPDEDALMNIWPQVYLVYQGELQEDGTLVNDLEEGEVWAGLGVVHPAYFGLGLAPVNTFLPLEEAAVVWLPGALHILPDGTEETITDPLQIPQGLYGVSLVSITGQTWSVPNELATSAFPPASDDFDPATQSSLLLIE